VHIHENCSFASTDATAAGSDEEEEEKEERMRRRRGWFLLEYWSMKVSK